jgi:hypothetical protein
MTNINPTRGFLSSIVGANSPQGQVVAYYNDFRQQLSDLITNLQDPNASLTLEGKTLAADAKNGAAGQMLINDWMDNEQTTISSMMDALKFMQTIEKTAQGLSNA